MAVFWTMGSRIPGSLALLLRGIADPFLFDGLSLRRRVPARSLDVLVSHPHPNVGRTIAKRHAVAGLEFPQKTYGGAVGEDEVGEVQNDRGSDGDGVERYAQLAHVSRVESTADVEDDRGAVECASDLEHWAQSLSSNRRANPQGASFAARLRRQASGIFANGGILNNVTIVL